MMWKPIPGWKRYEVSEDGRVRSVDMRVKAKGGKTALRKGRVLAQVKKSNGYLCVTLTDGKHRPQFMVHRLVAAAFIGASGEKKLVLHSDGNKLNNDYRNLRYGTQLDNIHDALKHGTQPKVLTPDLVREIRASTERNADIAKRLGLRPGNITSVRRGLTWSHVR